jgi:hypothetical protein
VKNSKTNRIVDSIYSCKDVWILCSRLNKNETIFVKNKFNLQLNYAKLAAHYRPGFRGARQPVPDVSQALLRLPLATAIAPSCLARFPAARLPTAQIP